MVLKLGKKIKTLYKNWRPTPVRAVRDKAKNKLILKKCGNSRELKNNLMPPSRRSRTKRSFVLTARLSSSLFGAVIMKSSLCDLLQQITSPAEAHSYLSRLFPNFKKSDSFFELFSTPLHVQLYVLHCFCADLPAFETEKILHGKVCYKTILKIYSTLRQLCDDHLEESPTIFGPEAGCSSFDLEFETEAVEIDECFLGRNLLIYIMLILLLYISGKKRKYNRGAFFKKTIVFGIVDKTTSDKVSFHVVMNRKKATLMPIIQKHIKDNCTIHHDDFASYRKLHDYGYNHSSVNHSVEFVAQDGTCTNRSRVIITYIPSIPLST